MWNSKDGEIMKKIFLILTTLFSFLVGCINGNIDNTLHIVQKEASSDKSYKYYYEVMSDVYSGRYAFYSNENYEIGEKILKQKGD
jgi:hypothetical protein